MKEMSFEEAIEKLEEITSALEGGDLSLDQAMARYEEGVKLAAVCQARLDSARRKIEMMVKGKDGRMKLKPFQSEPGQKKKARSSDAEAGEE